MHIIIELIMAVASLTVIAGFILMLLSRNNVFKFRLSVLLILLGIAVTIVGGFILSGDIKLLYGP